NKNGTGILQKILPFELKIFDEATRRLTKWREEEINYSEVEQFYEWIDDVRFTEYTNLFN
ncbi:hypothetical protein ACFLTH_00530, partial [Bacteroidota bacterium]